jgi:hypothetical protein
MVMGISLTGGSLGGGAGTPNELATVVNGAPAKTTPAANDVFFLVDSEDNDTGKAITYEDVSAAVGDDVSPERIDISSADSPFSLPVLTRDTVVAVDLNSGDVVINLPKVTAEQEGYSAFVYVERNTGNSNLLTINCDTTDTVRGQSSAKLNVLRDGIKLYPHTFLADHWDALNWERTDEIVYQPGNTGTTTVTTLQKLLDFSLSSGQIGGCSIVNNLDGTINVSAGEWKLRSSNTPTADCRVYYVGEGLALEPTDKATSYLVVNYNSGSPSWTIETNIETIACQASCVQAVLFRNGTDIHWMYLGAYSTDFMGSYAKAEAVTNWLKYGGGLLASSQTGRRISTTAGALYQGTIRFDIPPVNTNDGDTIDFWYRDGSGYWTIVAGQTILGNTQWDDGDGTLATTSSNRFMNWWLFVLADNPSRFVAVYPQTQHTTLAAARSEGVPTVLPPWAAKYSIGKLVAKVTVRNGTDEIVEIGSPFVTQFSTGTPVNHNDLANLQGGEAGAYYHLTQAQHTDALAVADVQIRHSRYEIIDPADDSGTLTLATDVSILSGYESRSFAYVYDSNAEIIQAGNPVSVLDTNFSPFPVPANVVINPTNGDWLLLSPFPPFDPFTPSEPFAIIYGAKIPISKWDEDAPLI